MLHNKWTSGVLFLLLLSFIDAQNIQNISESFGVGQSPGFPGNYAPNTKQRWFITIPDAEKYISFAITFMAVEGYSNAAHCAYDWVQLIDGRNLGMLGPVCSTKNTFVPSIGIYCNFHLPQLRHEVTLNTSQLVIEFCTDKIIQMQGFFFYWRTVATPPTPTPTTPLPTLPPPTTPPPPTICGNSITLVPGSPVTLNSPGYPPGPYPNNLHCTWNVTSITGVINITTLFFDVEGYTYSCYYDRVTVTEADGSNSTYCQSAGPDISNAGSRVMIQFITDDQIQRLGFQIVLRSFIVPTTPAPLNPHCGETYNLDSLSAAVQVYSPGWPNNYYDNANCNWTITNALYNSDIGIQLTFLTFSTERNYDYLYVTPANGVPEGFEGALPTNKTASYNTSSLLLLFTSDYLYSRPGFHILVNLIHNPFRCYGQQFKCKTVDHCIPGSKRCDGVQDCSDNSDEISQWCLMKNICGKMVVQPNIYIPGQRIVNGTMAKPGSWPWTVSVHQKEDDFQFCDGTLISTHWVVSAAHCFYGNTGNPSEYIIKVGSYHDYENDAPYERDVGVQKIWIHPEYKSSRHSNDISVVRLAKDVPFYNGAFNNHTGVACLPQRGYIVPGGTNCVVTGWGTTKHTGSDLILRQAVVPIVPNKECNDTKHYDGRITPDMICAGYRLGMEDTCQGDSGGPLVCQDSNRRWVLQGITSWGEGCAEPYHPGVYSRMSALVEFLHQVVNEND